MFLGATNFVFQYRIVTGQVLGIHRDHELRYYAGTIESGFLDELFRDRPCPLGECDPTAGTPIEVSGGVTTANVDFVLQR